MASRPSVCAVPVASRSIEGRESCGASSGCNHGPIGWPISGLV